MYHDNHLEGAEDIFYADDFRMMTSLEEEEVGLNLMNQMDFLVNPKRPFLIQMLTSLEEEDLLHSD